MHGHLNVKNVKFVLKSSVFLMVHYCNHSQMILKQHGISIISNITQTYAVKG